MRPAEWPRALAAQLRGAIAGGINAVQIRERDLDGRAYVALVRDCVALASGTACRVLVNDRLDIAIAAGAHGVHLREHSVPVDAARKFVHQGFWVGRSVHDAGTAVDQRNADYLIAGSVFETASKPGRAATLGLDGLRATVDAAGTCPVWAVGGITVERMMAVTSCGVRGVAAIGAFLPPSETADVEREVQKVTEALRFSLDRRG